jgi:large subunit ribosomal protein L25
MISLNAKVRTLLGRLTNNLRSKDIVPAVVYGPEQKNASIEVASQEFLKVLKEAGESSLIDLMIEGEKTKRQVLVHEIQRNPVTDQIIHIDFFQPSLKQEVEVTVPLVFEGVSFAVKDLGGTLVKNFNEVDVKALPQNLPHEIKVNIELLKNLGDHIMVKDLVIPKGVEIMKKAEEIIVSVAAPQKVEEDLATTVEEDVSKVEKVEKAKKEETIIPEIK